MDRLETMRVFAAIAESGGFAPAGRRLGLSPPAVTRAIAALEARLDTRLLHRTTRRVRLTESGERFLADCRRILGEVEEAEAAAAGSQAEPRGALTITASQMFGRRFVAPVVMEFLARYPAVTARLVLLDRVTDLIDEGLDVAVRIARLADSSASAVRVGEVRYVVCAAPAYLKAKGVPRRPADLAGHDAISFAQGTAGNVWTFATGRRRRENATPAARLLVNDAEVAIAAAVAGRGLTRVLSYQVAEEIKARRLRIVLDAYEPPPIPIHLLHLEGRRANARVRAFVDFAADRLRRALA